MANRKDTGDASLTALCLWTGLWQALVKELKALHANDNTLRRVISDPVWRKKLAEFLVDAATKAVEMFDVLVNPSDPRWKTIDRGHYTYVDPALTVNDFPVSSTAGEVTMTYVTFDHEPTTQEVLDEFVRRGLARPDRAQTESFLDQHPEERQKSPVIGLCGSVAGRRGCQSVACFNAYSRGVDLYWRRLGLRWRQGCRFLAVSM